MNGMDQVIGLATLRECDNFDKLKNGEKDTFETPTNPVYCSMMARERVIGVIAYVVERLERSTQ
jgi:hypothetical protein